MSVTTINHTLTKIAHLLHHFKHKSALWRGGGEVLKIECDVNLYTGSNYQRETRLCDIREQ